MANIFIHQHELASKDDVDKLSGNTDTIKDNAVNHLKTGIFSVIPQAGEDYPTTAWGLLVSLNSKDKTLQLYTDDNGFIYGREVNPNLTVKKFARLATENDLSNLQSQIDALKTKLGGVIRHAICLVTARKAVA